MIQVKCIEKFRDRHGRIYGYRLIDLNNKTQDVRPENLKIAIKNNQIHVVNLTLTSDDRLVDCKEHILQDSRLGSAPVVVSDTDDKIKDWFDSFGNCIIKVFGCGDSEGVDFYKHDDTIEMTIPIYGVDTITKDYDDDYSVQLILDAKISKNDAYVGCGLAFLDGDGLAISIDNRKMKKPIISEYNENLIKSMIAEIHRLYVDWKNGNRPAPINPLSAKTIEAINKATGVNFELSSSGKYNHGGDIYTYYTDGQEIAVEILYKPGVKVENDETMIKLMGRNTKPLTLKLSRDNLISIIAAIKQNL